MLNKKLKSTQLMWPNNSFFWTNFYKVRKEVKTTDLEIEDEQTVNIL